MFVDIQKDSLGFVKCRALAPFSFRLPMPVISVNALKAVPGMVVGDDVVAALEEKGT